MVRADPLWMDLMIMTLIDTLAASQREPAPALQPLGLAQAILRHLRAARERRRRRREAALLALSDHLRRDIGLPPFSGPSW